MASRVCAECGTAIPWGAPQCVGCGAYTHWRRRLSTLGITVGGGTVLVVIGSLLRIWFFAPPEAVRAAAEVQEFLDRIEQSEQRTMIGGAGRCKAEVAVALCVQTTAELEALDEQKLLQARAEIAELWKSIAQTNPGEIVFVDSQGIVQRNKAAD